MKFAYGIDEDTGKETLQFVATSAIEEDSFSELDQKIKEGYDLRLRVIMEEDTWQLRLILTPKKEE